jgi:hypothetical protein
MKNRKPTGELALFKEIWEERERRCVITGDLLGGFSVGNFAHIIPKSTYGRYRLNRDNIVLMRYDMHKMYDHQTHEAKRDVRFQKIFEKAEQLKKQYNAEGPKQ